MSNGAPSERRVWRSSPWIHVPLVKSQASLGIPGARTEAAVVSMALKRRFPSPATLLETVEITASASAIWEPQVAGSKMSPTAGITVKEER
jgi:hypothetical protein